MSISLFTGKFPLYSATERKAIAHPNKSYKDILYRRCPGTCANLAAKRTIRCTVRGAAIKCAECPICRMRYVLKQDSQWIGKLPTGSGSEHRLFCLCGEVSRFDSAKLSRYIVNAEIYRRGYGSADEVPLFPKA